MTKKFNLLLFSILSFLMLQSCNPDCDTASKANISMEPAVVLPGSEFLLRSSPPNFIQDRTVFIDDPRDGNKKVAVQSRFASELNGMIVTLPQDANSTTPVYVEDPDCSGDFIFVNPLQIESEAFFFSSDLFVVPPIPIIVVPAPPPAPPVAITNAWITPYRRSYCIWFVPEKDDQGKELNDLRPLLPNDIENFGMKGSHEFVVCDEAQRHAFANVNPVSGIVDKDANFIQIRIDRTSKGLGFELFNGQFIDPGTHIPNTDDWRKGGGCTDRTDNKKDFMLLTSATTGQQLLMIKAGPD